ncbi:CDK5 regulatory subunit-associated protein 2 isoform X6 [Fukomys damarensis]|uniref:CDK5 regulatory subunit-associated protein 2 isoform X6 n=1 Tax=Fukomys damarensis TaxID=885580 RepID=UPI00053FAF7E|nr:CDK5 regulatory subunit-associated protein 2 isoform X6 [Fukomys damarensis]
MMDSVLEEDVTLPRTFSDCSGLVAPSPDDRDGITGAGLGNGVLPTVSEEQVSPTRARNMKDFENHITELKKENFNLKLRIYFLEERMQQEFAGPTEHIYKTNIELKVEVESLKRELHEKEQLLIKASKAVESLAEGGGSEIQRVKEDARRKLQQVEDHLTKRILLLEGDVKAAQAELEKAFAGTETEKALRLSMESKLSEMKKMHADEVDLSLVLKEKDRLIEELKLSLKSKEALIQCLKEQKSQMASPDENVLSGELRGLFAARREEKERDAEAAQMEAQKEKRQFEEKIQALQEDLREKEREIATEKKNSLKRDKAIQGLTMALKSKEKEVEELNSEMEELSTALAKAREAPQKTQTPKFHGSEDFEAALTEKEALLAELHSENLTKSSENHRLQRNIKKVTQELSDLQQEKERLERDLEKAHREGSKGARTVHDLRNEVEKLRNEVNEREKAVENRYKSLLSESNKRLHNQEQVIKHLTESSNQKDLLLQKFNEKDLEAIQQHCYLMTAEDLKFRSEGLITEKCSSQQSPDSQLIFLEEKQQLDYEELMQVLKKERDIYTHLVKSLQNSDSIDNLQAELNAIFALRKQLEQDVLSCRNLQKILEEQISEIRRREEEPFSFYSDQTSYLSICFEEHSRFQVEHFSQEELKKKVSDLIKLVKELYTDNQHLRKTIFDLSCMSFQGNGGAESTEQRELLPSKEDEDTIKIEEDDENNFQSDQHLEPSNEIMEDCAKGGCKNGYLRHTDANVVDYHGAHKAGCPGDQNLEGGNLLGLLAPFFSEKAMLSPESRNGPDLLKALHELLLERMCLVEQGVSGEHLDGQTEKKVKQMAIQLRDELRHLVQANSFTKPHGELKSTGAHLVKMGDVAKVELKDASVQTVPVENHLLRFEGEGKRKCREERPTDAIFGAENKCGMPGHQATPFPCLSTANKDVKRSRLPILAKPSWSLGNTYHLPASQGVVTHLQGQILELQGELKEFKTQNKRLHQKLILAEAMMDERPAPDPKLLNVPTAQPLMGAAYQDSSGEQKGTKTTPSAQRDEERNCDQQTSYMTGKPAGMELSLQNEPVERIEEDNLTYQHILPESPEPSASHVLSDDEISEKSSLSRDQQQDGATEKVEMGMNHFSQDLLMEHIQEIRTLRKRLEESIKTNEKLRKQLERQGSEFDQGSTNIFAYGSELHTSLTSEIYFLRKQNQELNTMLVKGSQDKQKENEKLLESVSRKAASLEHLQQEYASVKGENERLQKEIREKERHNQQLLQEVHSGRQELSRVQEEVKLKQQLLSQNDKLLQSLRVELKMYEKLDEEHRRQQQEARAEALGAGSKGQNPCSDLHSLLTEIQALRGQLERSIETNSTLRSKLEEQLAQGPKKVQEGALPLPAHVLSILKGSLPLDQHDGDEYPMASDNSFDLFDSTQTVTPNSASEIPPCSGNDVDSLSCDSSSSATTTSRMPRPVAGHLPWASKNGRHVLGLFEDYDALWKQICQGQQLLAVMDIQTHEAPSPTSQELETKGPHSTSLSRFVSSLSTTRQILEEASKSLKLLWRVSLPTDGQCALHCGQVKEMKAEITKLHKKLFEQEKKLQNTVKLLEQSKHQEKVIFDQLVVTHKVLRKARGNLEARGGPPGPSQSQQTRLLRTTASQ